MYGKHWKLIPPLLVMNKN